MGSFKNNLCSQILFPSRLIALVLIFVAIAYGLQIFSPLRINTDAYRLLSMAVSASEGHGYLVDGHPDQFPNGYPFVVKIMLEAGIANSASLVALNLLFYALGLWVLWIWAVSLAGRSWAGVVLLWVATSWLLIKHATIPLSDAGYFGISLATLYFLWKFYTNHFFSAWPWLLAAILGIFLSLQFRTVGITLLPTAAATLAFHPDLRSFWSGLRKHRVKIAWIFCAVLVIGSICFACLCKTEWFVSQFLAKGSYFQSMSGYYDRQGLLGFFSRNLSFRIREMGELILNVPENKMVVLSPVFFLAGSVAWVVVGIGGTNLAKRGFFPLAAYMVFYLGLMVFWPYYDTRFWIALLPVFSLAVWGWVSGLSFRYQVFRPFVLTLLTSHIILGIVALAFSTRISFSGSRVSEYFGDEPTQMTYRYALKNGLPVNVELIHPGMARLLTIFDPLAKSHSWEGVRE